MREFGYRAHRTAACESCGKHLPSETDPAIVWGHSLDGLDYAAYCEACTERLRVKVVDRVVPEPDLVDGPTAPDLARDAGDLSPARVPVSEDCVCLPKVRPAEPSSPTG